MKNILIVLYISLVFLSSCATTYKTLAPKSFGTTEVLDSVSFSYKYGILEESGNKKFAKREVPNSIKVLSVKIVNQTKNELIIGKNCKFFSGNNELELVDPIEAHRKLKQGVAEYLVYMLLTPIKLNIKDPKSFTTDVIPIGLGLGPLLTVANVSIAASANGKFLKELKSYNLIDKKVLPGQTVFGLITVRTNDFGPIRLVQL
ncbi:MAG: hypothetical protein HYZ44_14860 [Bacteroidetes bacterium]|nr:hypothetical protein [Bacteroidota bacterium]